MPDISDMNFIADGPINGPVDVIDYVPVILCDVILNINDHQSFSLHNTSS